jgi:hypothetical protein
MGVVVKEKLEGSNIWWIFINYAGRRKAQKIGSIEAALKVKEQLDSKLFPKNCPKTVPERST